MMYERLVLIHELLAEDGTLYLHCAPNVSHMLKLVCDEVFGPQNFQNEISWRRASGKNDPNRYGRSHEVLLFYSKGERFTWNVQYGPFEEDYVDENYRYTEEGTGRRYRRGDLTAAKPGGDGRRRGVGRRSSGGLAQVEWLSYRRRPALEAAHYREKCAAGVP
jgi:adenine specific DNA methylase Mod